MQKKYQIIYADPAWSYKNYNYAVTANGLKAKRGVVKEYSTMAVEDICTLPVSELADENATLFIWATFPLLQECFEVIRAWSFEYKTCAFVWVKINKRTNPNQASFFPVESFDSFWGMGNWTRSNAEVCLLATKGKPKRESAAVHQIIYAPIGRHSEKPNEVREKIVQLCGDLPKIELFAREKVLGWDSWGNEIEADIDLQSSADTNSSCYLQQNSL